MRELGKVYWITGLSGAGKTTIGTEFYKILSEEKDNVIFLDGDELREAFGKDLGYSKEERLKCAMRYSRICKLLSSQGIDVIICTISMFNEVREWNRLNMPNYLEIYIKVPISVLKLRDQKGLYSGIGKGNSDFVVGVNLDLDFPTTPDIVIENVGDISPLDIANRIYTLFAI